MSNLYISAGAICIILCIVLYVAILRGLKLSLIKNAYEQPMKIVRLVAIILFLWILVISILAKFGVFTDFSLPPKILMALLIPITSVLVLAFNKRFTAFLQTVPQTWLTYLQVFRVPVEIFLWMLLLDNTLPIQMTFEGKNFDILVGLTAPIMAFLYQKGKIGDKVMIVWNIMGLGLLFTIVAISIMSFPTPLRVFMNEPANTAVSYFPFILLPAFLVMVAYAFHVFSLRRLLTKK